MIGQVTMFGSGTLIGKQGSDGAKDRVFMVHCGIEHTGGALKGTLRDH